MRGPNPSALSISWTPPTLLPGCLPNAAAEQLAAVSGSEVRHAPAHGLSMQPPEEMCLSWLACPTGASVQGLSFHKQEMQSQTPRSRGKDDRSRQPDISPPHRIISSHYSERQSLGASPSFGVFDNALPADSLTLYMAPGRGCWPTAPGQPSAPASREGPGGVAARGWWSVRERLIGMCRTACRDGRVMWMSPLRHGGQPA